MLAVPSVAARPMSPLAALDPDGLRLLCAWDVYSLIYRGLPLLALRGHHLLRYLLRHWLPVILLYPLLRLFLPLAPLSTSFPRWPL